MLEGVGLHTGASTRVRFRPAEPNTGIRFRRADLDGQPEIKADLEHITSTDRGTSLSSGTAQVNTVEHLLAAVAALQIDNVLIEIDGPRCRSRRAASSRSMGAVAERHNPTAGARAGI